MNGDEVLERLGLERERVLAAAAATESYAVRIQAEFAEAGEFDQADGDRSVLSASAFTAAGSFWSLVDAARGAKMFNQAAHAHGSSGWAALLAICAAPRQPSLALEWNFDRPVLEHPQPEALLLSQLWPVAAGVSDAREAGRPLDLLTTRARDIEAVPLGRLRIPLGYYLEIGWAIYYARRDGEGIEEASDERLLVATRTFLTRAGEATRAARTDGYHWRRLHAGLLPVEPEALAASMLVGMTWRDTVGGRASDNLRELLAGPDLAPLVIAEQILEASEEDEAMPT